MDDDSGKTLGKIHKVDVCRVWKNEATHFTPWLASDDNISELSNAVGIELEVDKVEASVGPYSADILAKDTGTGKYVIIENQLGKTNHDHLGKAITYGSVLDAGTVIWIAKEFTEQHQRALDWLNEYTSDELSFYGVQVEIWQIDDSRPAVRFNVISRPAEIKREDATGKSKTELSDTKKLQFEFWSEFRKKLLSSKIVSSAQKATPKYWFNVPLGKSDIVLSNFVNTWNNHVGVRVYISNKIADWALPQLEAQKEKIENEIGSKLQWNPNPENRDKVIVIKKDVNLQNRDEWDDSITWMVDMVKRFRKAFMPRIKKLRPDL